MKKILRHFQGLIYMLASLFIMAIMIQGCGVTSRIIYGADATPTEIREYVYDDGFIAGRIRAGVAISRIEQGLLAKGAQADAIKEAQLEFIEEVLERCDLVKASPHPMSLLNQYFYAELANRRPGETLELELMWAAGQRVLKRVGIKQLENKAFETVDFDSGLWDCAVDAYKDGVIKIRNDLQGIKT